MSVTLLSTSGMPLHRQLYLVLRDQISDSTFGAGDAIPSEEALGELYGVSRITVRRALQDLADQGYVERRQGRGTFVADRPAAMAVRPASIRASLKRAQSETEATVIEFGTRAAPADVRSGLGLSDGSDVLYILRVRTQKGRPLMLTEAWLPEHYADVLSAAALTEHALYELLESAGVRLDRFMQEISAQIADPTRARLLDTDIGSALLRIDRLVHNSQGTPVMRNSIFVDARHSRIVSEISGSNIDTAATGELVHQLPV